MARRLAITAALGLSLALPGDAFAQAKRKRGTVRAHGGAAAAGPRGATRPAASASAASDGKDVEVHESAPAAADSTPAAEIPSSEGSDAVTPKAEVAPEVGPKAAAAQEQKAVVDNAALQQELAALMDDLVQTRQRVAVIGKALFKTRVRVKIDNQAAEDQVAGRVTLRLDGAPIFSADGASLGDAERPIYDGFAAPGPHVLELEVEQRARRDEAYRYTQRQTYRFEVVRDLRTDLRLVLEDDSDIAEDFGDDREGEYDVRTRLQVRAVKPNED